MKDKLGVVIEKIIHQPTVQLNSHIIRNLQLINKYADSQKEKAYYLGSFLKGNNNFRIISSALEKELIQIIQSEGLQDNYYLHQKPQREDVGIISIFFILGGALLITAGSMQLLKGGITLSSNLRYLLTFVKDGGYQVLMGVVLLVGGYIRYRHEQKKTTFFRQLIN